jgi:hypothetical protein
MKNSRRDCTIFLITAGIFIQLLIFCTLSAGGNRPAPTREKQISGWLAMVRLSPGDLVFRAKLDTGAKNSSLNARNIVRYQSNGEARVRFSVSDRYGKKHEMDRPLVREAQIKLRNRQQSTQSRPVIILGICLGTVYKEVEVNLVDRTNFNYQMLIGRSYLRDDFLVDASEVFSLKPRCHIGEIK